MAGRGTQVSFIDALQGLTGTIMQLAGAPDADVDFLLQLRDQVLGRIGQSVAEQIQEQAAAVEESMPEAGGPTLPGNEAMPPQPATQSRGPSRQPDMSGATSELERMMSGA